jgi:hypothetical protein
MVMSVALGTGSVALAQTAGVPPPPPSPANGAATPPASTLPALPGAASTSQPAPVAPAATAATGSTTPQSAPPPIVYVDRPPAPQGPPVVYVDRLPEPGEVPPAPPPPPRPRDIYISLETVKILSRPFFEVDGEYRLHERFSAGALVGLGRRIIGPTDKQFGWTLGVQGLAYPVGSFHNGLQVGVEVVYGGLSGRGTAGGVTLKQKASEVGPGAFVGYKLESKVGFTFNVQLGARYMFYRVTVDDGASEATNASGKAEVLGRINAGWSF